MVCGRRQSCTLVRRCLYLGIQVDGELTFGGVNSAHYTGDFVYMILESTSDLPVFCHLHWQSSRRRVFPLSTARTTREISCTQTWRAPVTCPIKSTESFSHSWCQQCVGGISPTHYTGDFVYMILESTIFWKVFLDGLKLNGSAVVTTPYVIIDPGISFFAGPTTDTVLIACPLSSSSTISSSQEYTVDCSATCNVAYTVGGVDNVL